MRCAAMLAGLLALSPALAHERPHGPQTPAAGEETSIRTVQAHDPLDCYCRAQGRIFAPGEMVCLRTPQGPRMAECKMVINVMSWGMTDRACPES